jgi:hypothetical protein
MEEETIYNIIPKEYVPPPKDPRYKSKYPPNLPPTGSTFCHKTTSKPGVSFTFYKGFKSQWRIRSTTLCPYFIWSNSNTWSCKRYLKFKS